MVPGSLQYTLPADDADLCTYIQAAACLSAAICCLAADFTDWSRVSLPEADPEIVGNSNSTVTIVIAKIDYNKKRAHFHSY